MTLDVSGGLGHSRPRKPGDKAHFCISCSFPVSTFGRLYPCLHTYCLVCATDMTACHVCQAQIARIERISKEQGLFISSLTLQSFKSEEDLQTHTRRAYKHIMNSEPVKEALQPKPKPPSAPPPGPINSTPIDMPVIPGMMPIPSLMGPTGMFPFGKGPM